ncbi:TetR/AcrR family transcriptional regulator [Puniceibacterium sediminis]|uniref:Transcriptional regulator, TetR family n=1 Tax=Puniceibacterium sediminis TaxID=1608407 RepID=A0A238YGU9_9RHOB|nr:TetR/AcrR family transcriptional regulator [Puniceibacterium sediminis]SNR70300.1 transcriptional regulator, TetR family [Puniceibacterium sediminis]
MDSARRKPRADALRNRNRLIEAAKEILGRGGPEASLEAVARSAGVGIGTLYRHFPTREALFQAVYRHEVEQLIELAAELNVTSQGGPAVRAWMHAVVGLVATKRGLLGALAVVATDESKAMFADVTARMKEALEQLLSRAIAEEAMRSDITAEDLITMVYSLCYGRPPEPDWEAQVLRLLDIFIDGLVAAPEGRPT